MITNRWIERRQPHWDHLTRLLATVQTSGVKGLSHEQLRETAFLYRQIASDLSALRQDGSAPILERSLNVLMGRAHNLLYSGRKQGLGLLYRYFWFDYPVVFRRLRPFVTASLILFLAGALLGALITMVRPEFMRALLGPDMVTTIDRHQMWTQSPWNIGPQESSKLMTHNLVVTFTTYATGILGGLGTLYMIGLNGLLLGVVGVACGRAHMSLDLWSFVVAHGCMELPAIIIAGGAGLRIGYGLLFPGIYSRKHSLLRAGRESIHLMAGTIPMLILAGIIEGNLSPSYTPNFVKFGVGAVLLMFLWFWLFARRAGDPRAGAEAAWELEPAASV